MTVIDLDRWNVIQTMQGWTAFCQAVYDRWGFDCERDESWRFPFSIRATRTEPPDSEIILTAFGSHDAVALLGRSYSLDLVNIPAHELIAETDLEHAIEYLLYRLQDRAMALQAAHITSASSAEEKFLLDLVAILDTVGVAVNLFPTGQSLTDARASESQQEGSGQPGVDRGDIIDL